MAYQRPMVTVDQNMTVTPTSIERDQPAFIFGPNYELHRYTDAEEKPKVFIGSYDGKPIETRYPNVIDEDMVDKKGYTKLIGDNVVIQLANLTPTKQVEGRDVQEYAVLPENDKVKRSIKGGYSKLLFPGKAYIDYTSKGGEIERDPALPRNLVVGDRLVVYYVEGDDPDATVATLSTTIEDVVYKTTPYDLDDDSSYEGEPGTLVTMVDALPETVNVNKVRVDLVSVEQSVEFTRKNLAAQEGWQWKEEKLVDSVTETVYSGVKVYDLNAFVTGYFYDGTYLKVLSADLYLTYRELIDSYSDTLHSVVGGASFVADMLGTVDPDNPLAMGVYMACLNAATDDGDEVPPVYFMATPSDDKDGYDAVLNKATTTDRVYILAPTTRDEEVLEAVRNHVVTMSSKTEKLWRIAAGSTEVPRYVNRLESLMDVQNDEFLAVPVSDDGGILPEPEDNPNKYKYDKFRIVRAKDNPNGSPDTKLRSTVVKGDRVRFFPLGKDHKDQWGDPYYNEYIVEKVINNYTVQVSTRDGFIDVHKLDPADGRQYYVPGEIEIYHEYTSAESAEVIRNLSRALATRRMLNVFPSVFSMDGVEMTGEFAACAVAGLVSATEPQQPITNVTVRGIDNIPLTYQTYNKAELDLIASGGTFIVAQDLPGDRVYVRHQITTAYPDGNLNTAELSITKNVDSISYAFAEVFRPYYGKYNITPELLVAFHNIADSLISHLGSGTSIYGPQLILEQTEIQYVRQNELMKDHVDIGIRLGVPYPCNNIDIVLTV